MLRGYESSLIDLALRILEAAASRARAETVGTLEVRLALRVLLPFVRNRALLKRFWEEATHPTRFAWQTCQEPLSGIRADLYNAGWDVASEDYPPASAHACIAIGQMVDPEPIIDRYGVTDLTMLKPRAMPAIAIPGQPCAVVMHSFGQRRLMIAEWGLKRHRRGDGPYLRATSIGDPAARFWRKGSVVAGSFPGERCIVPVTRIGYGEAAGDDAAPPQWFGVAEEPIFSIAGLAFGHPYHAAAFHVAPSNPLLAPLAGTMPLILHREDEARWLEQGDLEALVAPFPSQLMRPAD